MRPSRHTGRKVLIATNVFGRDYGADYYMIPPKLIHGFIRLGCHVHVFNDREVARGATPFLSTSTGGGAANRRLIETCRNFRPDLLLLGHCEIIENQTLQAIRDHQPDIRICYRNVDAVTDARNLGRLERRAEIVDAIFMTACIPLPSIGPDRRARVYFVPNPVDPAIDSGRGFERSDQPNDLFFAVGNPKGSDTRLRTTDALPQRLPGLRADFRGTPAQPPVRGWAYVQAMNSARMGLSISRPDDIYLYASDRMSQLLGNGLLTFISKASGFQDLFQNDQLAFYEDLDDLVEQLKYFVQNDKRRQEVAEAGWRAAHSMFASDLVAKYMLERSFAEPLTETYHWPTEIPTERAQQIPRENSIAG